MHIFLTGAHDVGKTTLINKILDHLPNSLITGGFRTFKGEDFAPGKNHVLIQSASNNSTDPAKSFKVALRDKSKYGFEAYPEVFDDAGVDILKCSSESDLIVMDELGFMESGAHKFQKTVMDILDGETPVLGAVKPDSNDFLDKVRSHSDVKVIEVTLENRNDLLDKIIGQLNIDGKPLLSVNDLTFCYEDAVHPAISDIDLKISRGTVNVILGPSGCGKTTLCRCLTGIIPNAYEGDLSGDVLLYGESFLNKKLSHIARKIGLVMQEPDNQIVASTVEDDIAFGPENMMMSPESIRMIVDDKINKMGIQGYELRSPTKLSGGEKQRTIISGILALDPEIMVFDEPMSNLDEKGKQSFIDTIKILSDDGKTIIIVEHDFYRLDFADNWIIVKDGKIVTQNKPDKIEKQLLEVELWQ